LREGEVNQPVRFLVSARTYQLVNSVFLSQQISTSQLKSAQKPTNEQIEYAHYLSLRARPLLALPWQWHDHRGSCHYSQQLHGKNHTEPNGLEWRMEHGASSVMGPGFVVQIKACQCSSIGELYLSLFLYSKFDHLFFF